MRLEIEAIILLTSCAQYTMQRQDKHYIKMTFFNPSQFTLHLSLKIFNAPLYKFGLKAKFTDS